jgi:hypothetical protein
MTPLVPILATNFFRISSAFDFLLVQHLDIPLQQKITKFCPFARIPEFITTKVVNDGF